MYIEWLNIDICTGIHVYGCVNVEEITVICQCSVANFFFVVLTLSLNFWLYDDFESCMTFVQFISLINIDRADVNEIVKVH